MMFCMVEWCLRMPLPLLMETSDSEKSCLHKVFRVRVVDVCGERESVCVCVWSVRRGGMRVCVWEGENVDMCVCFCMYVFVSLCLYVFVSICLYVSLCFIVSVCTDACMSICSLACFEQNPLCCWAHCYHVLNCWWHLFLRVQFMLTDTCNSHMHTSLSAVSAYLNVRQCIF